MVSIGFLGDWFGLKAVVRVGVNNKENWKQDYKRIRRAGEKRKRTEREEKKKKTKPEKKKENRNREKEEGLKEKGHRSRQVFCNLR